jgi:hypothetical protein
MLLGFSSVRLKPVPDQLRFLAAMTLHRLAGSAVYCLHVQKQQALANLDRPANFALGWESSRGGCALGIWLVADNVGLQQDDEAGSGNGGVHRGR